MFSTWKRCMQSRLLWLLLGLPAVASPLTTAAEPEPARQQEILYLLHQDCGACHGMNLKGGLGPALLPEQLSHLSEEQVAVTILHGRPGTPMPPWAPFLNPEEARWLAARLKSGAAR